MIRKNVSPLIVGSNFDIKINQSQALILELATLELATIAIPKCLIQIVAHLRGLPMLQKRLRENLYGSQHLCNFDVAHDLTRASTTCINQKETPHKSVRCSTCNPKQEVASFSSQPPLPKP